jgi:hypothetical protein
MSICPWEKGHYQAVRLSAQRERMEQIMSDFELAQFQLIPFRYSNLWICPNMILNLMMIMISSWIRGLPICEINDFSFIQTKKFDMAKMRHMNFIEL